MANVLRLYENCVVTKGFCRSVIADHQRDLIHFTPNSLANLFDEKNSLSKVWTDDRETNELYNEYRKYLIENELAFDCPEDLINNFPVLGIENWDYPAHITNVILFIDIEQPNLWEEQIEKLIDYTLVRHMEVNLIGRIKKKHLISLINFMENQDLYSYDLVFKLDNDLNFDLAINFLQSKHKIHRAVIHNQKNDRVILSDKGNWGNIFIMKGEIGFLHCGLVNQAYFTNNLGHISESQKHNTCLNRKLTIMENGDIKNCPSMPQVYGNIYKDDIKEIILTTEFQKTWFITKDQTKGCKDCEFRYICTDCRAYVEEPEFAEERDEDGLYSKPLKCGYNPYTGEWAEWSTSPLKQKGIEYYGMQDLVKKEG